MFRSHFGSRPQWLRRHDDRLSVFLVRLTAGSCTPLTPQTVCPHHSGVGNAAQTASSLCLGGCICAFNSPSTAPCRLSPSPCRERARGGRHTYAPRSRRVAPSVWGNVSVLNKTPTSTGATVRVCREILLGREVARE